ncbi:uncharacterized protein [Primulina eburnea]|uniref:uncharacterized protein n=1 Tax=Primulina eburnea TaxID=1245227 RepID=UPI003C6C68E5
MDVQFSWLLVIKIDGGVYRREAVNLCNGKSKFFVNLVGGRVTSINELDIPEHVMKMIYRFCHIFIGMSIEKLVDFDTDFLCNWEGTIEFLHWKIEYFANCVEGRLRIMNELDTPEHVLSNGISVVIFSARLIRQD